MEHAAEAAARRLIGIYVYSIAGYVGGGGGNTCGRWAAEEKCVQPFTYILNFICGHCQRHDILYLNQKHSNGNGKISACPDLMWKR